MNIDLSHFKPLAITLVTLVLTFFVDYSINEVNAIVGLIKSLLGLIAVSITLVYGLIKVFNDLFKKNGKNLS